VRTQFLIISQADDLHALAVQAAVRRRGSECHIVESDQLSGRESITFALESGARGRRCCVLRKATC
jgi:hypothetical protein